MKRQDVSTLEFFHAAGEGPATAVPAQPHARTGRRMGNCTANPRTKASGRYWRMLALTECGGELRPARADLDWPTEERIADAERRGLAADTPQVPAAADSH